MNAARRKLIDQAERLATEARALLDQALAILEGAREEEEDALSSLPESLQDGGRGSQMQACIDAIDDGIDALSIEDIDFDAMRGEA